MLEADRKVIHEKIAPLVDQGGISLLLGAGFSIINTNGKEKLPNGDQLRDRLLQACNKKGGGRTTLKDAYQLAKRTLPNFNDFFIDCFTVHEALPWQKKIFEYAWSRVYTTNIDNVLNVALKATQDADRTAGDFKFFNYSDEGLVSGIIGAIPIVTIHGNCLKLDEGFVFSTLEYAKVASKILDWHNDLAARLIAGGMVVVGNQLDESDIDTYLSHRRNSYETTTHAQPINWIVSPDPDEIKAENWRAAGFYVIDAKAEEFFIELYAATKPRTIGDIVLEKIPTAKRAAASIKAMTWFKSTFKLAFEEIEQSQNERGILKHYITGAEPDWFYIVNDAHAQTHRGNELTSEITNLLRNSSKGIGILHIIGPSGSGKTTAIRNSLREIVRSYRYIYEFDGNQSIDKELLRDTVDRFNDKAVFVFYSAAEYYYAIKEIADREKTSERPYCLFILEDRTSDYKKNKRQLNGVLIPPRFFEFGDLKYDDAKSIAQKIEITGLRFEKFSEKTLDARAGIILDKEKGYGGDLLSALYSLTTHENFEQKIFQDYESAGSGLARKILDLVSIIHSLGHSIPIDYIASTLNASFEEVSKTISDELAGVLQIPSGTKIVRCRHRVIASYYFDNNISRHGSVELLSNLLKHLSGKFTISDIRLHPLPYRIYRDIVSFEFVYEKYFSSDTRDEDCEQLYHEAQIYFGQDGIFWLHFGRYYRKIGKLDEAIDCFRTGLDFYESYQTRHSLGMTLLEQYIETGDEGLYSEGVHELNTERLRRVTDPYPAATLLQLLTKIIRNDPKNQDARNIAKECVNAGMKHFRNDDFFQEVLKDYVKV